jgi:16S rRNA (adenine1518-N6/adenine1519-N6)-dimethyltransferase
MAKPRYGQHFLVDPSIARREVRYAALTEDDIVLEIGPGKGIITHLLAESAKQVIAIEIDQRLVGQLKKTLPSNVMIIPKDALVVDFNTLPRFTKIVSNLPFEISSPITFKFLNSSFSKAILIYQKDFALRLVARPGTKEYSRLTVAVAYKAHCRILEDVPQSSFSPAPEVNSCIVELVPREKPAFEVMNESFFFKLTRQLFTHRRKKIRYTVKTLTQNYESLPYIDKRVEELTPEQIGTLSDILWQLQ